MEINMRNYCIWAARKLDFLLLFFGRRARCTAMFGARAVAFAASPSWAAWSDTNWGMQLSEIRSLYPDLSDRIDAGFTGRRFQASTQPRAYLGLPIKEVDFTVLARQGLQQVVLLTPEKDVAVDQVLMKRFGKPISTRKTPYMIFSVFVDPRSKDEFATVADGGGGTAIRIRPMTDEELKSLSQGAAQ
jgi:hypothetical protein